MQLSFQIFCGHLFVVSLYTLLLQLLSFVDFLVIVFYHLLIGFSVNWGFSQWLLSSPFLNLHDDFCLFIFSDILPDCLFRLKLFPSPPNSGPFIKYLKIFSLQNFKLDFLLKHQKTWLPLRQINISRICLHHRISYLFNCSNHLLFLSNLASEFQHFFCFGNCSKHSLPLFFRNHNAISLMMFIYDESIRRLYNRFHTILLHFFRQMLKLIRMFFKVFPGHTLQFGGLQDSFVRQFLDAPNQSI